MLLAFPFLFALGVLLPVLGWLSLRSSETTPNESITVPTVRQIAVQIAVVQIVVAGLAILAVYGANVRPAWSSQITVVTGLAALAALGCMLLLSLIEARRPLESNEAIRVALRKIAATDPVWIGVTIFAAIVEEFAYRGVLILIVASAIGYWPAATISAVLFGLAHLSGGRRAAIHSVVFGIAMQVLVYLSGGLLLAIAVHILYDLLAAWLGHRIGKQGNGGAAA